MCRSARSYQAVSILGAIAAAMARTSSAPFKIFTAGFPGSPRDETAAAARIAEHLGCEHIVLPMQPQDAADVLPAVQAASTSRPPPTARFRCGICRGPQRSM